MFNFHLELCCWTKNNDVLLIVHVFKLSYYRSYLNVLNVLAQVESDLQMTTISNISDALGDYMLKGWVSRAYANLKLPYAHHFLPGPHRSVLSHPRMRCPSYAVSEG